MKRKIIFNDEGTIRQMVVKGNSFRDAIQNPLIEYPFDVKELDVLSIERIPCEVGDYD